MSIKKIKVASVWVGEADKEITAKATGKKYNVCNASVKVADDCPNFAGRSIKMGFFADVEKKRTGKENAEYFKKNSDGQEIYLDVTEGTKYTNKDGIEVTPLEGKKPSKAKLEGYLAALEELKNQ